MFSRANQFRKKDTNLGEEGGREGGLPTNVHPDRYWKKNDQVNIRTTEVKKDVKLELIPFYHLYKQFLRS